MTYKGDESDDEYDDFAIKKDQNIDADEKMVPLSKENNEQTVTLADSGVENMDVDKSEGAGIQDENGGKDGTDNQDEEVDDLEWFKSKRKRIIDGEDNQVNDPQKKSVEIVQPAKDETGIEESDEADENVEVEEPKHELTLEEKHIDKILITGRLFLRNILYSSTEDDFTRLFSPFGPLKEVHIAVDTKTGKSKGFAYIQFENSKDAVKAGF